MFAIYELLKLDTLQLVICYTFSCKFLTLHSLQRQINVLSLNKQRSEATMEHCFWSLLFLVLIHVLLCWSQQRNYAEFHYKAYEMKSNKTEQRLWAVCWFKIRFVGSVHKNILSNIKKRKSLSSGNVFAFLNKKPNGSVNIFNDIQNDRLFSNN